MRLPLPDTELLNSLFSYNPETGEVFRRRTHSRVGYPTAKGYLRVKVKGKHYRLHNLIWKLHYGEDVPSDLEIDHINRVKTDNRICNLRLVTQLENLANRKPRKTTRIARGIYWDKSRNKWAVRINNKRYGRFLTLEEATRKLNEVVG
jgi:hypothetical protein